ncbi:Ubiquitin-like protein [Dioscorea alata]|uniref:Ubiquitin-like protein n=1 Tax=Dioscorea alata TaxID=55571 RepID=A0ACB7VF07_DIOAL|nr:Ubiquitin-like protein [Dioscorea alata]
MLAWEPLRSSSSSSSATSSSSSVSPSSSASLLVSSDDEHCAREVGIGVPTSQRRSFSYHLLPEPLIRLTILKLDDTSFDVRIERSAAVWELKIAVEDVFDRPAEEGGVVISWPHVWGLFCLCYGDQKLIDDKAILRNFGIKDGDQLRFMRHRSGDINVVHNRPRRREKVPRQHLLLTVPEAEVENHKDEMEENTSPGRYEDENSNIDIDEVNLIGRSEFRLADWIRRWLSCAGLQQNYRKTRSIHNTPFLNSDDDLED